MSIDDIKIRANFLRTQIKDIAADVKAFGDDVAAVGKTLGESEKVGADFPEGIACAKLSYRHLEDAVSRLEAVTRALDGQK